jgi:hypothetical protein
VTSLLPLEFVPRGLMKLVADARNKRLLAAYFLARNAPTASRPPPWPFAKKWPMWN